jgi:succinylarginine dihydrolase
VNFDGIVGPTHHYGGLSHGNLASMRNKQSVSHPKQAALQGLAKMKFMADLGLKQAVLPPHERPHVPTLRRLGYTGSDAAIIACVAKDDPWLLSSVSNASAMWAANAATVSPSADTPDGRVHFTPANLVTQFHRSIEPPTTAAVLRRIFADESRFVHHPPLQASTALGDEGAANHTRLCTKYGEPGVELFTYGGTAGRFPARQSQHASQLIARTHGLTNVVFVRQSAEAIDAGAFHNDVVAVGNRETIFFHELAWSDSRDCVARLRAGLPEIGLLEVENADVPLADAISSYLFNSQLVTLPDGRGALVAPVECRENPRVNAYLERGWVGPVHYVDVRQSMRNGGGPACLRLRVVLTEAELAAMHPGVIFDDALHATLRTWVEKHYRDELTPADLADPKLLDESRAALDELSRILRLGSLYEFQQ